MISLRILDSVTAASNYYSQSGHGESADAPLVWAGRGAEIAGLSGEVDRADLISVLGGLLRNPETGEEQRLGKMARDPESGEVERVYRPGLDLTFSPPKSFSIAALAGGDGELRAAIIAAAKETMGWFEREVAQTRLTTNGKTETVKTGNLLYATTVHETNRKGEPQLHVHVLVSTATWAATRERWGSLAERSLFRLRKAGDGVFKDLLAEHGRALGYDIEASKHGPELGGFSQNGIAAFSQRNTQINHYYDRMKEQNGWTHDSRQAKELAVGATRDPKRAIAADQLRENWRATGQRNGVDVDRVVQQARDRREGRAHELERTRNQTERNR